MAYLPWQMGLLQGSAPLPGYGSLPFRQATGAAMHPAELRYSSGAAVSPVEQALANYGLLSDIELQPATQFAVLTPAQAMGGGGGGGVGVESMMGGGGYTGQPLLWGENAMFPQTGNFLNPFGGNFLNYNSAYHPFTPSFYAGGPSAFGGGAGYSGGGLGYF